MQHDTVQKDGPVVKQLSNRYTEMVNLLVMAFINVSKDRFNFTNWEPWFDSFLGEIPFIKIS